jgi:hypothetical protein
VDNFSAFTYTINTCVISTRPSSSSSASSSSSSLSASGSSLMSGRIYSQVFLPLFILAFLPALLHAQVSKIVFTNDPQSIKPNEISGIITFQLQDSSGNAYKADETIDIEFLSTSASGEFLSPSSENPVTKTISTGSANKNFRYRDSAQGSFTITISVVGRTSGAKWNKSQNINVSSSASSAGLSQEQGSVSEDNDSSSDQTSSHYGANQVTSFKQDTDLKVSAGRDRVGIVGSPLEFVAETDLSYTNNSIFVWNFGDGSEKVGEVLNHTYQYPGEYVVILNVSKGPAKAISRINVKVAPAELSISAASPDRVEITNNSVTEAPLFGRAIVSGSKVFIFPKDSIIKGKQKISFSSATTGLTPSSPAEVSLIVVGTEANLQNITARISEQNKEKISEIQDKLASLKQELATIPKKELEPINTTEEVPSLSSQENLITQTALVVDSISVQEDPDPKLSWFGKIKRFFLRNR